MTKLQRYDLDNVNLSLEGFNTMVPDYMGALCWYADVSALEAENERLRAWIEFLLWGAVGIASQGSRTK